MSIQRIVLSLGIVVFAGALVAGATGAFFSDTETSTGNTFTAGALDLKVDSEAHYNGLVCVIEDKVGTWQADGVTFVDNEAVPADHYPQPEDACEGTWAETDLGVEQQFFSLTDIKPGDEGENTISLHVYDNDAWGRFIVNNITDLDNTCTEPENEAVDENDVDLDPECDNTTSTPGVGELAANVTFNSWLDQGNIPGFQCNNEAAVPQVGPCNEDPTEGDNILNGGTVGDDQIPTEVLFWTGETVDEVSEGPFELSEVLAAAYGLMGCSDVTGHTDYGVCHGLAQDGRMVGSTTYYFGLGWSVPDSVGNEAQTDSLNMDLVFEVEQHRNNPDPFALLP